MWIHTRPLPLAFASLLVAAGCGSDGGTDPLDPGPEDGVCEMNERVGSIEATLTDAFTSVQGKVTDAVPPSQIADVVATDGACRLMRPPTLFCDPSCASGTTCDASGMCVPTPAGVSVGTISMTGLKQPVEMTASAPVFFYTNLGTLDHPGFDEGDKIVMNATGEEAVEPFAVGATGITAVSSSADSVSLDRDVAVSVSWSAPGPSSTATVHIDLNIAQHGGTPGWIECEVPDTGSFDLPVALTNQLLDAGFSGFPSLTLTRLSADHADTAVGCVQLVVQSSKTFDVEIDGLTSCGDDNDCTPPETCQPDLTCG